MKHLGIKYQLRITTLIPVFFVALLFAVFYNSQFNKDLNQYMSRLGESYIRQMIPAAQLALMEHDQRTLQGLINASTVNPEIRALTFYDAKGHLLAYRGGKHPIDKPFQPLEFTGDYIESQQLTPYTIHFIAPVTIPRFNLYTTNTTNTTNNDKQNQLTQADDILGWVSIDIDTQSILIKRYQMYIVTIFITLFGLLISLTIHYFLSRRIYKPISRLRRSMKQILSNEFETHISVSSTGELGDIEKGCSHLQKQYLNIIHDLTHHIEVATADLQQGLELLEEKNIEMSLEKKKSEEKTRQLAEFIANMSHEIRTPMNGVIGFTNLLLESKLDTLQLDYVKTIKSSAQDLLTIINDILDYSKMDAGKLHLDCIPLDIRACIDEVLTLAAPNANRKGIDLIPSTDIKVPKTLLGDPLRIKQIITNLVSNAVKFTDQGYVLIRTTIEQETDKDYLIVLSVTDTGIGISSEDQTKLFNAFNQADTSITRRFGGTGLGLVICKKLAETMQGRITLTSEPRKGTTFTVKLKLEKMTSDDIEKQQNYRFDQISALCFDENSLHLEATCNGLGFWGIQCVPVTSFNQLSQAFIEHQYCQIAFINVDEGKEKALREILRVQTIPCVLISKWLVQEPESFGAKAFLFKPLSIQKIRDTLEKLLNLPSKSTSNVEELNTLREQLRVLSPNILLAEDNPVNRMLMNSLLGEYTAIDAVVDGKEALQACHNNRYELLLLDLQMPGLDGLNCAKHIKQECLLNKQTPIILISANANELSHRELTKEYGIDSYLQKPIEERKLLQHIIRLVNKSQPKAIDWELCIQKVSGNQVLARKFLSHFVIELASNKKEFLAHYHQNDWISIADLAHKVHGACCFCGVPNLQKQMAKMEKMAQSETSIESIQHAFAELIRCIDDVLNEYQESYS